jgi:hypothetical protein
MLSQWRRYASDLEWPISDLEGAASRQLAHKGMKRYRALPPRYDIAESTHGAAKESAVSAARLGPSGTER